MARPVFRTKRSQYPTTSTDEKLTHQKGKVGERSVRRFLSRRGNRGGIFVDARRVERLTNREYRQVERSHDVVGMNASLHAEVAMSKPSPDQAVRRGQKPVGRQRHDEYSSRADYPSEHDHSIRRDPLC